MPSHFAFEASILLARDLIDIASATVVCERRLEAAHSFVLGESTALVLPDELLLLTCGGARLELAHSHVTQTIPAARSRFVRFDAQAPLAAAPAAPGPVLRDVVHARFASISADVAARFGQATCAGAASWLDTTGARTLARHDHRFSPVGYSLNAHGGGRSIALHVSPEPEVRELSLLLVGFPTAEADGLVASLSRDVGGSAIVTRLLGRAEPRFTDVAC